GLYYNRHRYYDPLQGRYITQDPIGLKGGWNFYQYPLNPVINVDPQGLVDINLYPESDLIHSVADEINIPGGFAPIFPDTCYHLTHYWPAAADIPVASDN
ncbi:RHS repeat-associated core domain-containing protein, partial [Escherichia coli]